MKASELPEIYLDRVNGGDAGLLSELFAPGCVFCGPNGQVLKSRDAIREFYAMVFSAGRPNMAVGRKVIEGNRIVFELINRNMPANADDPAQAIDLIEIDGHGQITKFVVFTRPGTPTPPVR